MEKKSYLSIDEYINSFPDDVQKKLQDLRNLIKDLAPEAQEKISYQMPTFFLKRNLVYFAAYSKHIGFYPGTSGLTAFKNYLDQYKTSKGAIQFPIEDPLPMDLITRIVLFRVEENLKIS